MPIDFEAEYNNTRRVPETTAIVARWLEQSAELRSRATADWAEPYGPDPRHRYDVFWPTAERSRVPVAAFIHGGYWQARDRQDFSFIAGGLLANGIAVAMPSYRLAPSVRIIAIIEDIRAFLVALYRQTGQRPVVTGHSAGGHLTAAMLATDWSAVADVPVDLVRAGYAISGVFDLRPLLGTSFNAALRETPDSARAISPIFGPVPRPGTWLTAAVGAVESPEFIRQSLVMAATWSAAGVAAECVLVPSANHFTVIDDLANPNSAMVQRIASLARQCACA